MSQAPWKYYVLVLMFTGVLRKARLPADDVRPNMNLDVFQCSNPTSMLPVFFFFFFLGGGGKFIFC